MGPALTICSCLKPFLGELDWKLCADPSWLLVFKNGLEMCSEIFIEMFEVDVKTCLRSRRRSRRRTSLGFSLGLKLFHLNEADNYKMELGKLNKKKHLDGFNPQWGGVWAESTFNVFFNF